MASAESSGSVGLLMFDLVLWGAVILGIALLIRYLAKPAAAEGGVSIAYTTQRAGEVSRALTAATDIFVLFH